jgi:hypothetical protein
MKEADAMRAVGRLVGGTPGPWDEFAMQTYSDEFETWSGPHAGEVLDTVCAELVRHWEAGHRPSVAEVRERWSSAMAVRTPMLPPSTAVHCDGSGWNRAVDGTSTPCPRCNGALAAVYADPSRLDRWRDGVDLPDLEVGVERTRAGLRYVDRREPVHCQPWPEEAMSPALGKTVAWKAYAEVCAALGRDPGGSHFATWATPT